MENHNFLWVNSYLVGGFNHLENYEFVDGTDYPIYEMENNQNL